MLAALTLGLALNEATAAVPTKDSFLIDSLPTAGGTFSPSFKQYSGFMPLGDAAGTHLFFWFVESQRAPAGHRPVALLDKRRSGLVLHRLRVLDGARALQPREQRHGGEWRLSHTASPAASVLAPAGGRTSASSSCLSEP